MRQGGGNREETAEKGRGGVGLLCRARGGAKGGVWAHLPARSGRWKPVGGARGRAEAPAERNIRGEVRYMVGNGGGML
jgi:hypothetical protein